MKQRAVIYNNYLETGGGGERSTLELAGALDELGFEVSLVTAQACSKSVSELLLSFGMDTSRVWPLVELPSEGEVGNYVKQTAATLFVNHTFCSFIENPAPLGLYMAMFPSRITPAERAKLLSYQGIVCNSHFTKLYTERRWGSGRRAYVLSPPISSTHLSPASSPVTAKEKIILQVGRFNFYGHNKCQREAISAFLELRAAGAIPPDWKFIVVGHINFNVETEKYLNECLELAAKGPVIIETNANFERLRTLYNQAACLWQCTGMHLAFGVHPEFCEHLGLVALDAFAYGTIPIVYQRSGVQYLLEHGINGYSFGSTTELGEIMSLVSRHFHSPQHQEIADRLQRQAQDFSYLRFREGLQSILQSVSALVEHPEPLSIALY